MGTARGQAPVLAAWHDEALTPARQRRQRRPLRSTRSWGCSVVYGISILTQGTPQSSHTLPATWGGHSKEMHLSRTSALTRLKSVVAVFLDTQPPVVWETRVYHLQAAAFCPGSQKDSVTIATHKFWEIVTSHRIHFSENKSYIQKILHSNICIFNQHHNMQRIETLHLCYWASVVQNC